MKGKNGVKLADFIREMINTEISEKPVKSRLFRDLEGVKNPLRGLLLSGRSGVRITSGTPKTPPENPVKSRASGVFSFLRRNSKNEKITNFH